MIIEEYDESLFIQRFENYERVETAKNPNGNFSYRGLRHLFEYLDEITDEDNPLKLDVIAICCDYSEYKNLDEYLKEYNTLHTSIKEITGKEDINKLNEEEQTELKSFIENEINEKTTLIKFDDDLNEGFIIQQY